MLTSLERPSGTARRAAAHLLACTLAPCAARTAEAALPTGAVLDASSWERARDLLPPEILERHRTGAYASPVAALPPGLYGLDEPFLRASEATRGKFKIDEHGSAVEAATGALPEYSFGAPFPDLDEKDADLARQVLRNQEYAYWSNGSAKQNARLIWLRAESTNPERVVTLEALAEVLSVYISGGGRGGAYAENLRANPATAADPCVEGTRAALDLRLDLAEFRPENQLRIGH